MFQYSNQSLFIKFKEYFTDNDFMIPVDKIDYIREEVLSFYENPIDATRAIAIYHHNRVTYVQGELNDLIKIFDVPIS